MPIAGKQVRCEMGNTMMEDREKESRLCQIGILSWLWLFLFFFFFFSGSFFLYAQGGGYDDSSSPVLDIAPL